jgi:hypothetical protein
MVFSFVDSVRLDTRHNDRKLSGTLHFCKNRKAHARVVQVPQSIKVTSLWLRFLSDWAYKQDMPVLHDSPPLDRTDKTHLARLVFFVFLLTFMIARISVFLIMSRRMPDLYLCVGGTHIHHLNYGIFLLAGLSASHLFRKPTGRGLQAAGWSMASVWP